MDKLCIIIPAYNEEDNIARVINEWYPIAEKVSKESRLLIIDDGSKDGTYGIICKMAGTRTKLEVLTKSNGGHGAAVLYGYRYAIEHGADYIFQTDSDGQTDPAEFESFWNLRKRYDAILGYRRDRGDGKLRAFVEKTVCLLLHIYFGIEVPDANAPFRLMKADVLAKYIDRLPENYHLPNIMITTYFAYYREKLIFKEISFKPRQGGTNTINIKRIVKIGWKALGDFYRLRKEIDSL